MQELIMVLSDWRMAWLPVVGLLAAWKAVALILEAIRETVDDFGR